MSATKWAEGRAQIAVEAMLVQQRLGTIHLAFPNFQCAFNKYIDLATQMALLKAINNSMRTAAELVSHFEEITRSAAKPNGCGSSGVNVSDGGQGHRCDITRGGDPQMNNGHQSPCKKRA